MKTMQVLMLAGAVLYATPVLAGFDETDHDRQVRWAALQKEIFGSRTATTDERAVQLDVPERALDAAVVPVTITVADPSTAKALYLVIDDNPSPVAAHFTFGAAAYAQTVKLRVRVNTYTGMHAVLETKDGRLLGSDKFVKASGGCSAPMGVSDEEAMRNMGEMRLKVGGDVIAHRPVETTLMVRHPNFNGMQMNTSTRDYTPARYIQNVNVRSNDRQVFRLDTDISLASNPVITFEFLPESTKDTMKVDVTDSQNEKWSKSFGVAGLNN